MSSETTPPIETILGKLLFDKKWTLAVAESCTGGLITHRLTNVPGSSAYVVASVVAYAYEAKVAALGVSWETLNKYGAVSEETVREMASGVRGKFGATIGLAITGIAGPGGGMPGKPVGLTYFALAVDEKILVESRTWKGDRIAVKEQSAQAALEMLLRYLRTPTAI